MKKLISLLLVVALLAFLCTTNPTTEEFAAWYASETGFAEDDSFLGDAAEAFIQYLANGAERTDYKLFSIFSYGGRDVLGIGLMFFPLDELGDQIEGLRSEYADWLDANIK